MKSKSGPLLVPLLVGLLAAGLLVVVAWRGGTVDNMAPRRFYVRSQLEHIADDINRFQQEKQRLPVDLAELYAVESPAGLPTDYWGHPFHYVPRDDGTYELMSLGEDGAVGGTLWDRDLVARAPPGPPERIPLGAFLTRLGSPRGFWLTVAMTGGLVFIAARRATAPTAEGKPWVGWIAGVIVVAVTFFFGAVLIGLHIIPTAH